MIETRAELKGILSRLYDDKKGPIRRLFGDQEEIQVLQTLSENCHDTLTPDERENIIETAFEGFKTTKAHQQSHQVFLALLSAKTSPQMQELLTTLGKVWVNKRDLHAIIANAEHVEKMLEVCKLFKAKNISLATYIIPYLTHSDTLDISLLHLLNDDPAVAYIFSKLLAANLFNEANAKLLLKDKYKTVLNLLAGLFQKLNAADILTQEIFNAITTSDSLSDLKDGFELIAEAKILTKENVLLMAKPNTSVSHINRAIILLRTYEILTPENAEIVFSYGSVAFHAASIICKLHRETDITPDLKKKVVSLICEGKFSLSVIATLNNARLLPKYLSAITEIAEHHLSTAFCDVITKLTQARLLTENNVKLVIDNRNEVRNLKVFFDHLSYSKILNQENVSSIFANMAHIGFLTRTIASTNSFAGARRSGIAILINPANFTKLIQHASILEKIEDSLLETPNAVMNQGLVTDLFAICEELESSEAGARVLRAFIQSAMRRETESNTRLGLSQVESLTPLGIAVSEHSSRATSDLAQTPNVYTLEQDFDVDALIAEFISDSSIAEISREEDPMNVAVPFLYNSLGNSDISVDSLPPI